MYNQPLMRPIAPPQKKMKAWPLIFTLSLIALIFASIWLLFELPQELDYLFDSFGELDMFRNFFSIVADLLFFTAVLLFFLFAVTLYKKRSAKTIFSLVQLFWMIGAAMVVLWYLFFIVDMSDYMFGYHDYDYYNYYPAGYEHYYFFSIADVLETFSFWIAILVLSILSACKSFKKGSASVCWLRPPRFPSSILLQAFSPTLSGISAGCVFPILSPSIYCSISS